MPNEYNEIICTVCLDSLKKNNHHSILSKYAPSIISLSCGHTYHFKCIISWFTKSCSFLCPVCKNPDKLLLENFLPEVKNTLHKEILKNKCDFHTQEEYEEYCENCIKQGNMLKIIDLQQMLNAHNQRILDDDYNAGCDISNIVNNVSENFYNYPNDLNNISEIIDTEYEPYVASVTYSNNNNNCINNYSNNYYQQQNISTSTMHNRNLNFVTNTETDIDNDNEIMERNIYSSSSLRNRYIFDDDDDNEEQKQDQENEEIERDEMIAYARGAINCILDDRSIHNSNSNNNNDDNKSFIRNQNSLQRRRRRRRHRSSVDLENIFKIISGQNISNSSKLQEEGEEEEEEEYENILLHHTTKPSFIHKYRFYIIFFILFVIGYLIFL